MSSDGVSADMDFSDFAKGVADALTEWAKSPEAQADLKDMADKIKAGAVRRSPVGKTGKLKAGWEVEISKDADGIYVEINNKAPYAVFVEKGHRAGTTHVAPQPMIVPAITEVLGINGIDHQVQVRQGGGE